MRKGFVGLLGCGVLFGMGSTLPAKAQVTASGGGYLFRRKLDKGATFTYAMTAVTKSSGLPKMPQGPDMSNVKITTTVTMKVKEVTNKSAKLEITTSDILMNGNKVQDGRKAEEEMGERGQRKAGAGTGQPGEEIEYPEKPIKVGDTIPIKLGALGEAKMRFVGFKPFKGKNAALWQMPLDSSMVKRPKNDKNPVPSIKGSINTLISMEDGWPLSTTVNTDTSMQIDKGSQKMTAKTTSTIIRQ